MHRPSAPRPAARTPRPRPAPAALAPRRLPERARRLRSEAPAAMIAGSGARARAYARARLGDPGRTDGPRPDRSPVSAAECGQGSGLIPARPVFAVELSTRLRDRAPGRRWQRASAGAGRAPGEPRGGLSRHCPPGCGNNFLLPRPRAQELRGEGLGRSLAILEPDDDTAAHQPRGSFPRPLPAAASSRAPGSGHRLE
ncbi:atherin-like [Hippopotamus amphibius kiboko]|uniref:atherin-like n=1 Tax=Hippopotamus amphibius kiboko TaxID=575201 RepID=UPI0025988A95|nr:atherin-like [Hippopotamus amphibius kiboko]